MRNELIAQPAAGQQFVQRLLRRQPAFDARGDLAGEEVGGVEQFDAALLGELGYGASERLSRDVDVGRFGRLRATEAGRDEAGDEDAPDGAERGVAVASLHGLPPRGLQCCLGMKTVERVACRQGATLCRTRGKRPALGGKTVLAGYPRSDLSRMLRRSGAGRRTSTA